MTPHVSRRALLASSILAAISQFPARAKAADGTGAAHRIDVAVGPKVIDHHYEVSFTEQEWRARLSEEEFRILREGGTEHKKSSPLWKEKRDGHYTCKGCDLGLYNSDYKVVLNKGWVFFKNCEPDSVLTGNDLVTEYGGFIKKPKRTRTFIETHCRRCGSHLGHMLYIKGQILHCINGTSLKFTPSV